MLERLNKLAREYAYYKAGWWEARLFSPLMTEWYCHDWRGHLRRVERPKALSFWYRPSFWRYVWEHWRD